MSAAENLLIEKLADEIASRITSPAIPVEVDLWSSKEVAAYLKCKPSQVINRYASLKSFPEQIRLPNGKGGFGHPRWHARDIISWAEQYKGK